MTKKERTIKACRELAAKYREPEGESFFLNSTCPLCPIHDNCRGCPLGAWGSLGCCRFSSYKDAADAAGTETQKIAFNARATFFDRIIPILEGIPASRFTKRGWKYFDELDRSW